MNTGLKIDEMLIFVANHLAIIKDRAIYYPVVVEVLVLLKVYVKFLLYFNLSYVPKELLAKTKLCLNIIYHAISPID